MRVRTRTRAREQVTAGVGGAVELDPGHALVAVDTVALASAPPGRAHGFRVDRCERGVPGAQRGTGGAGGREGERLEEHRRADDQDVSRFEDVGARPAAVVVVRDVSREVTDALERAPLATVVDAMEQRAEDEFEGVPPVALRDQLRRDARE